MDILTKASCRVWLFLAILWLNSCHGQRTTNGFMPGVSPSSPNNALNVCYRTATPKPQSRSYTAKNARIISTWCSIYDDVLPCLSRTLITASRASDMYLKLIYNETMATRMSESICQRLPYLYDLTCVEEGMGRVVKCMNWTDSIIEHFYSQFIPSRPLTSDRQEMATIYACIISVTTAMCLQKELTTCSFYQRKLMYDYYIMLSGQCREVAGIPETTTGANTTTISTEPSTSQPTSSSSSTTASPSLGSNMDISRNEQTQNKRPRTGWSRTYNVGAPTRSSGIAMASILLVTRYIAVLV